MSDHNRHPFKTFLQAICKIAAMAGAVYLVTQGHHVMAAWFLVLAFVV